MCVCVNLNICEIWETETQMVEKTGLEKRGRLRHTSCVFQSQDSVGGENMSG